MSEFKKNEWSEETRKEIEQKAYWKWCEAGKPLNQDQYFWSLAEKELIAERYAAIEEEIIEINFRRHQKNTERFIKTDGRGYQGESFIDPGYFYAPYVPLSTTPVVSAEFPEIRLNITSEDIVAKTRKLKAVWTMEAAQDLRNMHDISDELTNQLIGELNYIVEED